ncbi:class II aaRS and biotin synthetase [Metschnikowia bicuspidata var. bicuspidata NRRL YB-4993]|uniref:Class II aaRS and biotin synthetase n=1 Tax=Metschnikowia bicuspidata var. bicuspidata NRRL YB-4993 TaxID=869754 RepID=A0A1A0HGD9_9ASCO|nr:class II aaRS and biotin synthetase [Metschnikowia bicuspidata var. bicuspidata NRRL YB-4993]OBA23071.1 class II aaRS and biotin synthetase [Metschnikowia bicuspidata var. bicuspidata NRRL YB-4993]
MNVLVYSGKGSTTEGVRHTVELLRQHLSPYYAVITVSEQALLHDPWMSKTAMLVMPGGADLPYCGLLNGPGNRRIQQYVRAGGRFLGFCAGGYYASLRCEFQVGDPAMEVSGPRELAFFPGTCRGCVYEGFVYESHQGARAVPLAVNTAALGALGAPAHTVVYYNGGGVFADASQHRGVEVLARYAGATDLRDGSGDMAAAVYCKYGKGAVVLSGVHPEYTPLLMRPAAGDTHFLGIVAALRATDDLRARFLAACLGKTGLRTNDDPASTVPRITPLYMAAHLEPRRAQMVVAALRANMDFVAPNTFEDAHDTFVLHGEDDGVQDYMLAADSAGAPELLEALTAGAKHIKAYTSAALPEPRLTPYFDMRLYFDSLARLHAHSAAPPEDRDFGSLLCYGEVVSSTNTLLDANPNWLRHLPTGFTLTASTQVAGRGRGGNVWVNPRGVMATSVLFRVAHDAQKNFNIVTLQYLCALAMIELILGYGGALQGQAAGYEDMPLRLKWPNDMYALKPEFFSAPSDKNDTSSTVDGDEQKWAKVSGALVNSQFINGEFYLVWGCGVNVLNEAPTTSLNSVLEKLNEIRAQKGLAPLPPYNHEMLLAKTLFTLGQFFNVFKKSGLLPFLSLYYKRWFHLDQRVRLDKDGSGNTRECVIKGITSDYGLLVAEDIRTRETLELQPDGNSFDIFKGLVYKKR